MRRVILLIVVVFAVQTPTAYAHSPLAHVKISKLTPQQLHVRLHTAMRHHKFVAKYGKPGLPNTKFHKAAVKWTQVSLDKVHAALRPRAAPAVGGDLRSKWIAAGEWLAQLAQNEGYPDPWPNCPDPYFDGSSWDATAACEGGGNWALGVTHGASGTYCGPLQFHPGWWAILRSRFGLYMCG